MLSLRERFQEMVEVPTQGKSVIGSQCGKENFDTSLVVKW